MSGAKHYNRLCLGYGCTANMKTNREDYCARCKQAAVRPKSASHDLTVAEAPDLSRGACVGEDPELFFDGHPESIREAKSVCARCPLVDVCLEYALDAGHVGVWGNSDDHERRLIKRRRAKAQRAAS